jgi:uncharacterized protein
VKAWIDIDNPPQVQYLLPFRRALEAAGADVLVTARDYGMTFDLLRQADVDFHPVGTEFGASKRRKVVGVLRRAGTLTNLVREHGKPDLLICASRSAALAAWRLGIPSFALGDYEHVHVGIYRLTGTVMVIPDVIDPRALTRRGLKKAQVIQYRGLKEDFTFAGIDVDAVPPHSFEAADGDLTKILFRPPAEQSHYYSPDSSRLELQLLAHLARQESAVVVFSPRYPSQAKHLEGIRWVNQPILLEKPVSFVPLLKAVDAVVCSGGTMLREAAYLGIPAYSIFQSTIGGVDRYLESIGRVTFISSPNEFERLRLEKLRSREPLRRNPDLLNELVQLIVEKSGRRESAGFRRLEV